VKRLGILGTFVWDTVWTLEDQAAGRPLETWGGVSFSLASAAATRPEGWEIVPIAHVGEDLYEQAHAFLDTLGGVGSRDGVVSVRQPNNRVELVYHDANSRGERMSGGVRGWTWPALAPYLAELDALYVDFLSGWEMDLATARMLREFSRFRGPVYADLHSLFLGPPLADAPREPRRLPHWEEWLRCFDVVQVNAEEFELLTGTRLPATPPDDAHQRDWSQFYAPLEHLLGYGPSGVFVTRGAEGATYVADRECPRRGGMVGAVELGHVWGAAAFSGLLGGLGPRRSVERANAAAAIKLEHRGGSGLYEHLLARRGAWEEPRG
jgi:sugar/nucleoside kinase (ribokinase family)